MDGRTFALWGAVAGASADLVTEVMLNNTVQAPITETLVHTALWFLIIGTGVALGLGASVARHLNSSAPLNIGSLCTTAALGAIGGFTSGLTAQAIFLIASDSEILRVFCWGLAGLGLGGAVAAGVPRLTLFRGALGGWLGGLIGGSGFLAVTFLLGDLPGRVIGISLIGAAIGMMIAVTDAALRDWWLEVVYPGGERKTVTLSPERTSVGGDARRVSVYARGAPPISHYLSVRAATPGEPPVVIVEDVVTGQRVEGGDGLVIAAGALQMILRSAIRQAPRAIRDSSPPMRTTGDTVNSAHSAAPVILRCGPVSFPLRIGRQLSAADLRLTTLTGVIAEVTRHPREQNVLGLTNRSQHVWRVDVPNSPSREVIPGQSLRVAAGTVLHVGDHRCELRSASPSSVARSVTPHGIP